MQIQNLTPEEIYSTNHDQFYDLMQQKIYKVNPRMIQNEKCVQRLVKFLGQMTPTKRNLRVAKELIKFYQVPILYFFSDLYAKIKKKLSQKLLPQDPFEKQRNKIISTLQQIGWMVKLLLNGSQQKNQQFQYFTQYGILQKDVSIKRRELQYHTKYLNFLNKCFKEINRLKENQVDLNQKMLVKQNLETELSLVVQQRQYAHLQRFTIQSLQTKIQEMIRQQYRHSPEVVKSLSQTQTLIKKLQIEKEMEELKQISPCCRTFFYQNQPILQAESQTLEYKNYIFPYDPFAINKLRSTISGFLNRAGGVILVGIYEGEDKRKQVRGQILTQNKKQEILKQYRYICSSIYPNIVSNNKYTLKFVPIKHSNGTYFRGKYILRINIQPGEQKSLYSFLQQSQGAKRQRKQFVAFRTTNQVLKRPINQQTLQKYKDKLLYPKRFARIHQQSCPQPERGIPIINDPKMAEYIIAESVQRESRRSHSSSKQLNCKGKWVQKQKFEKNKFMKKIEPIPQQKQKNSQLYYVNLQQNQRNYAQQKKNNFFSVDAQDEEQKRRKQKLRQKLKNSYNQQDNQQQSLIDFRPINKQSKYQELRPSMNINIQRPQYYNKRQFQIYNNHQQVYKINQQNIQKDHIPLKKAQQAEMNLLIIGYPHQRVKQLIQEKSIKLKEPPIYCNHKLLTWIKVYTVNQNYQMLNSFIKSIMIQSQKAANDGNNSKVKVKKIFRNIFFSDQTLLNKLINKFKKSQEFVYNGIYYFQFKNEYEAIIAFKIGWQLNSRIKFISDQELKKYKLKYIESKEKKK